MAEAQRIKSVSPEWAAKASKAAADKSIQDQIGSFAERSFEDLSANERTELLKFVAIRLGLVKP